MYELTDNADFRPTADWEHLRFRAAMLRRLREFFDSRGFLEIETPILSADTVVDRHLDPFYTEMSGQWSVGSGQNEAASGGCPIPNPQSPVPRLWLQTSPEFAMKRLLAAGPGESTRWPACSDWMNLARCTIPSSHWSNGYQPGEGLDEGMQLTSDLCEAMLSIRHTPCADCSKNEVNASQSRHTACAGYVGRRTH